MLLIDKISLERIIRDSQVIDLDSLSAAELKSLPITKGTAILNATATNTIKGISAAQAEQGDQIIFVNTSDYNVTLESVSGDAVAGEIIYPTVTGNDFIMLPQSFVTLTYITDKAGLEGWWTEESAGTLTALAVTYPLENVGNDKNVALQIVNGSETDLTSLRWDGSSWGLRNKDAYNYNNAGKELRITKHYYDKNTTAAATWEDVHNYTLGTNQTVMFCVKFSARLNSANDFRAGYFYYTIASDGTTTLILPSHNALSGAQHSGNGLTPFTLANIFRFFDAGSRQVKFQVNSDTARNIHWRFEIEQRVQI